MSFAPAAATKREKYQELRTRINKHCPWLMELRFGCEVVINNTCATVIYGERENMDGEKYICTTLGSAVDLRIYLKPRKTDYHRLTKILGIPPTLQDVLAAIPASLYNGEQVRKSVLDHYNLTKPLSDQSEETLDFLLSVIE
ncbi:hypothetical protein [Amorphus orientalis]|uniref:Uncharacterized protein n=1 Tax=Amorphus orientalis TaxID=649198 RepID=A0AAE3VR09_9HYPH|nr:hypothetical protein [Amorphus orientalis]MDQ0316383.1 hypothetical protein [Amorphus orientalis]